MTVESRSNTWLLKLLGFALVLLAVDTALDAGPFLRRTQEAIERRDLTRARDHAEAVARRRTEIVEAMLRDARPRICASIADGAFEWRVETVDGRDEGDPAFASLAFDVVVLDGDLDEWLTIPVGVTRGFSWDPALASELATLRRFHWRVETQWNGTLLRSATVAVDLRH